MLLQNKLVYHKFDTIIAISMNSTIHSGSRLAVVVAVDAAVIVVSM